ncbi:MAG: hypothetical protein GY851_21335, partial [bacterium]|nr:hypothetical protein [bacterium]
YEVGLPFDWEDALADYQNETDLYFEEVDVGTGAWGPVEIYRHGDDPMTLKSLRPNRAPKDAELRTTRGRLALKSAKDSDIVRPFTSEAEDVLDVQPHNSARNARGLRLTTTWLERVTSYTGAKKEGPVAPRSPR